MIPILIRVAEPEDAPECVELMIAVQAMSHWRDYPTPPKELLLAWLSHLPVLLVAVRESQVVGLCGGAMDCSPLFPEVPYLKESILYVREEHRWMGIAQTLFLRFAEYGLMHGAQAIVRAKVMPQGERLTWVPMARLEKMRPSAVESLTEVL